MPYTRTNWVSGKTPLSADNFNNIEDGIKENAAAITELKGNMKKQYVQGGTALTQNMNGYFRSASISFPVTYKLGTTPHVCATVRNYSSSPIDVRLNVLVKDITNSGCNIFIGDPQGELSEQGYEVEWISVGIVD